jgi:hypothetical protein
MSDLRIHPVYILMRNAPALGYDAEEVEALKLRDSDRLKVMRALKEADEAAEAGENQRADEIAREAAEAIVEGLPPEQQSPGYLRAVDGEDDGATPDELAACVLGTDDSADSPASLAAEVARW